MSIHLPLTRDRFDRTGKTICRTATVCIHRIWDISGNREKSLEGANGIQTYSVI